MGSWHDINIHVAGPLLPCLVCVSLPVVVHLLTDSAAGTPSVLHRLFMGRTKGLQGDGAGMDVRVSPPKARDSRFERSMGEALRQQNEKLEMEEVQCYKRTIQFTHRSIALWAKTQPVNKSDLFLEGG